MTYGPAPPGGQDGTGTQGASTGRANRAGRMWVGALSAPALIAPARSFTSGPVGDGTGGDTHRVGGHEHGRFTASAAQPRSPGVGPDIEPDTRNRTGPGRAHRDCFVHVETAGWNAPSGAGPVISHSQGRWGLFGPSASPALFGPSPRCQECARLGGGGFSACRP